jgi:hypothetical protein
MECLSAITGTRIQGEQTKQMSLQVIDEAE